MKDNTVVICDSDAEICRVCELILYKEYRVDIFTNFEMLFKHLEGAKPDVIVIEILMPDIHRETVIKALLENDTIKDIPVILFSTLNDIEKISERVNAAAFIKKPFDIKELRETVRKHIKQN